MKHLVAPAVNIIVMNKDTVLLSRRQNTGWKDGYLCLPGGHIEKQETPIIATIREIYEELGVAVNKEDVEFLSVAHRNSQPNEYVSYIFIIKDKQYTYENNEPDICSELVWANINDLPSDLIDDFTQIIQHSLINKKTYLEIGY